jgi:protein-S-isoprenylcysteine O-methyltransferase Ste14
MLILQIFVFTAGTLLLLTFSWPHMRDRGDHGFYRFFAWVAILGVISLHLPYWFKDIFSLFQMISWTMLIGSIWLAILGFRLLRHIGQPKGEFENTTRLVTVGVYAVIRHPLYASLLLLGWGAFFKHPDPMGFMLAGFATLFLYLTARVEERENLVRFGEQYKTYMQETRMFVPNLF